MTTSDDTSDGLKSAIAPDKNKQNLSGTYINMGRNVSTEASITSESPFVAPLGSVTVDHHIGDIGWDGESLKGSCKLK